MTDSSRGYQQFFAEMKRRRVFRVMAVYGATAFVLLQVADLLAQGMGLSDQVLRVTTFLVLIGFPIAVLLAWAFDSTPDGMKRTEDASPEEILEILALPASKRWISGLLALAGVALLFGGGWWMGQRSDSGPELSLVIPGAQASEFKTIAVLPFENMGGDEANTVLASGLHADVQTALSRLADLRVISVQDYVASETTVGEIALELRVDHILQGRVRRSGNQVRVNVLLIDVATSENLWVEDFDREVTPDNLFAIQSDIARRVALNLDAELSPADIERLEAGLSTDNMAALNLYYQAEASSGLFAKVDLLGQAVELAPGFVEAWSLLAQIRSFFVAVGSGGQLAALEAVRQTESLAPGSLEALAARAAYTHQVERDALSALSQYRAAEKLAPSDGDFVWAIGTLQQESGDFDEGVRTLKRAAALDPQNVDLLVFLARALHSMRRWNAADQVVERALSLDPSNGMARAMKVELALAMNRDPRRARALAAELGLDPATEGWALTWIEFYDRDYEAAMRSAKNSTAEFGFEELGRLTLLAMINRWSTGTSGPYADSLKSLFERVPPTEMLGPRAARGLIYAGQEAAGLEMLAERVDEARSEGNIGRLWNAAETYADMGRGEDALTLLEEVVGRPVLGYILVAHLASLENGPWFDRIRDDPRFKEVLRRQEAYEAQAALDAEADGPWP